MSSAAIIRRQTRSTTRCSRPHGPGRAHELAALPPAILPSQAGAGLDRDPRDPDGRVLRCAVARAATSRTCRTCWHSDLGPSRKHPFGTDDLGRDQLSEVMFAGRISLMIGLVVALLSTVVGVTDRCGRRVLRRMATDQALSAVTDLFLILPDLALLAVAILILGQTPRRSSSCSRSWLDVRGPHRARAGLVVEGEGVRRGGARIGRLDHAHPRAPHHAQLPGHDHGERDPLGSRRRSRPRPRCRSSASACSRRRTRGAACSPTPSRTPTRHRSSTWCFFPGLMLLLTILP